MKKYIYQITAWFLIAWFPFFGIAPVYAQYDDDILESYFSDDSDEILDDDSQTEIDMSEYEDDEESVGETDMVESEYEDVEEAVLPEEKVDSSVFETGVPEPVFEYTEERDTSMEMDESKASIVQNAVLEGIQLSSEPGAVPDESIITCYFIFRDKPTSYFYEVKQKENMILFEFNDVELGSSPIPSMREPPIQGFRMKQEKVDANREVVGLNPEWHDILKVSFSFDAIPEITVQDEYSVISFSFKWSSDPEKVKDYTKRDEGVNKVLLFALIGGGVALGGGVAAILLLMKDSEGKEPTPLSIDDLPEHPIDSTINTNTIQFRY